MKALREIGRELLGLFVDDWTFAAAITIWVALIAFIPRLAGEGARWIAPLLFAGLAVVLLASVSTASKKRR